MSSDSPNAAPPCATMPTQRSSVSALLALQSLRSAGGTSRRVVAAGVPRPSAPWHDLHHAWNSAAPEWGGSGVWMAKANETAGKSAMHHSFSSRRKSFLRAKLSSDGEVADPLARRGEDRIAQRGRQGRHPRLAHAPGQITARRDMDAGLAGRRVDPDYRVVIEVALLRPAVPERHLPVQRVRQPHDARALH